MPLELHLILEEHPHGGYPHLLFTVVDTDAENTRGAERTVSHHMVWDRVNSPMEAMAFAVHLFGRWLARQQPWAFAYVMSSWTQKNQARGVTEPLRKGQWSWRVAEYERYAYELLDRHVAGVHLPLPGSGIWQAIGEEACRDWNIKLKFELPLPGDEAVLRIEE